MQVRVVLTGMIVRAVSITAIPHDIADRHHTARSFAAQGKTVPVLLVPIPLSKESPVGGGGDSDAPSKYDS